MKLKRHVLVVEVDAPWTGNPVIQLASIDKALSPKYDT